MKTLLAVLVMMVCVAKVEAAYLRLAGELTWNVTDPQCSFRLKGKLQNLGTDSGSLRLALWATQVPYPAAGTLVAEFPLGQLGSGFQFDSFTFKTKATLPEQNGEIYYTITVMEFTNAGWRNQLMVPTGTRTMFQGQFADQKKWYYPKRAVVAPPEKLKVGNLLVFTEKAMGNLNLFPLGWRERTKLTVLKHGKIDFESLNREKVVDYKYSIVKRKYLGRRADVGLLEMTYKGPGDVRFTKTVTLFFQGPQRGTYMSSVTGALFGESTYPWTAWGTFKLR